jgi:hypothetical protein
MVAVSIVVVSMAEDFMEDTVEAGGSSQCMRQVDEGASQDGGPTNRYSDVGQ